MKLPKHSLLSIQILAEENVAIWSGKQRVENEIVDLSEGSFSRGLRSAVRGLWSGVFDLTQFLSEMFRVIEVEYLLAWHAGMRAVGMDPREMNEDERAALQQHIVSAQGRVFDFGLYVEANSKAAGGKLSSLGSRTDVWLTGYNTVYNEAMTFAANDPNLMWRLGPTEQHCGSCSRLNGKVKRASVWDRSMLQPSNPPNPYLECGGWRCKCSFEVTTAGQSRGPLPRLSAPIYQRS